MLDSMPSPFRSVTCRSGTRCSGINCSADGRAPARQSIAGAAPVAFCILLTAVITGMLAGCAGRTPQIAPGTVTLERVTPEGRQYRVALVARNTGSRSIPLTRVNATLPDGRTVWRSPNAAVAPYSLQSFDVPIVLTSAAGIDPGIAGDAAEPAAEARAEDDDVRVRMRILFRRPGLVYDLLYESGLWRPSVRVDVEIPPVSREDSSPLEAVFP